MVKVLMIKSLSHSFIHLICSNGWFIQDWSKWFFMNGSLNHYACSTWNRSSPSDQLVCDIKVLWERLESRRLLMLLIALTVIWSVCTVKWTALIYIYNCIFLDFFFFRFCPKVQWTCCISKDYFFWPYRVKYGLWRLSQSLSFKHC